MLLLGIENQIRDDSFVGFGFFGEGRMNLAGTSSSSKKKNNGSGTTNQLGFFLFFCVVASSLDIISVGQEYYY